MRWHTAPSNKKQPIAIYIRNATYISILKQAIVFHLHLKAFRKQRGWTQQQLADRIGAKRSLIGAYEEGRAEPKLETLRHLAVALEVPLDALLNGPEGQPLPDPTRKARLSGSALRVVSVAVTESGEERASLVPLKASAGYLGGYGDVDFMETLPAFSLPFPELKGQVTRRVFQIQGDSMLPIPSGSYIVGRYVQDWSSVASGTPCIVLTQNDGIVFKRVYNRLVEGGFLELVSDNTLFSPFVVGPDEVLEVWQAEGVFRFDLDAPEDSRQGVAQKLDALHKEVEGLKSWWNKTTGTN
jgi:transcriptional regulator with XRE-family HTH domain